jgi:hypothetical protein
MSEAARALTTIKQGHPKAADELSPPALEQISA